MSRVWEQCGQASTAVKTGNPSHHFTKAWTSLGSRSNPNFGDGYALSHACAWGAEMVSSLALSTVELHCGSIICIACSVLTVICDVHLGQLLPQLILNVKYMVYIPKHALHPTILSYECQVLVSIQVTNVTCNSCSIYIDEFHTSEWEAGLPHPSSNEAYG